MLSDLFYERGQFEWMFNTLHELHQSHSNGEDELMNQYVVLGLCKAAAICDIVSIIALIEIWNNCSFFGIGIINHQSGSGLRINILHVHA